MPRFSLKRLFVTVTLFAAAAASIHWMFGCWKASTSVYGEVAEFHERMTVPFFAAWCIACISSITGICLLFKKEIVGVFIGIAAAVVGYLAFVFVPIAFYILKHGIG